MKTILLTQGMYSTVDDEDFDYLNEFSWYSMSHGRTFYARSGTWNPVIEKVKQFMMHRLIMKTLDPKVKIDHIDGNGLNNQKSNLRFCLSFQNMGNRNKNLNGSSKFKGVSFHKRDEIFIASIGRNGKRVHLGNFQNEQDAAKAYDIAALNYFGEFAKINFPS